MTAPLDTTFETFFETKTAGDVEGTMAFFSPDLVSYIDATLGWDFDRYDALKAPLSSTRRTDTPELFGGELRILAAIDFAEGKQAISCTPRSSSRTCRCARR